MKLAFPSELKHLGLLGMNARNINYISRYNERSLFPLVDNKLKTKQLIKKHGLQAPELYGYIQYQGEIKNIMDILPKDKGFVIKPARGSGGKGILVINSREGDCFVKPSGEKLTEQGIKRHVSNILSGLYSLGGKDDIALLERLITFDKVFEKFSFEGVPDIRVIVYRGYPVMAMMRLSTSASDGKANLHQGAVGVGIDIATGKAISAVQFNRPVEQHPDTEVLLSTLEIPQWSHILDLASAAYDMTNLGYLGVDIVLDEEKGAMLLELNARPGLAIQIANAQGLLKRLKWIDRVADTHQNREERTNFSLTHFGGVTQD
jgi:alpha-L-glutamate ligase-like protein